MMKQIFSILTLIILTMTGVKAQPVLENNSNKVASVQNIEEEEYLTTDLFRQAYEEIKDMLEGKKILVL